MAAWPSEGRPRDVVVPSVWPFVLSPSRLTAAGGGAEDGRKSNTLWLP